MSIINTNIGAMKASSASLNATKALGVAMERLSTGKRINSAKDDAAGLAIATTMSSQIRGMSQGIRNANDGISLAQTAEGALQEATNILLRINELAVQSSTGTYQNTDRTNLQAEVTELKSQLKNILDTEFNGVKLFSASADNTFSIQVGNKSTDTVSLTVKKLDLSTIVGGTAAADSLDTIAAGDSRIGTAYTIGYNDVALGAEFNGTAATAADVGSSVILAAADKVFKAGVSTGGLDISLAVTASTSLATLKTAMETVSTARAQLGAGQSRLESAVSNLSNNVINLSDARSRIEDADYAQESTALAKAQILSQASTAMLAQANQSQQNVLSLLR